MELRLSRDRATISSLGELEGHGLSNKHIPHLRVSKKKEGYLSTGSARRSGKCQEA